MEDWFTIYCPVNFYIEIGWISDWLFGRFTNIRIELKEDDLKGEVSILKEGVKLTMPLIFFERLGKDWFANGKLPVHPTSFWRLDWKDLAEKTQGYAFPILFGQDDFYERKEKDWVLKTDIFGGCFFCLSRYEEMVNSERDQHIRFSAYSSHAYKFNYLEIPLADYYAECLVSAISRIWPEVTFKRKKYEPQISHDVDSPSLYAFRNGKQLVRSGLADIFLRRDLHAFRLGLRARLFKKKHIDQEDPHNSFQWIMDQVENVGLKSTFYFLAGQYDPKFDGNYKIDNHLIKELILTIHNRGHHIGLHPSYTAGLDEKRMKIELARLRKVFYELKINEDAIGARMHYLRWFVNETWEMLDNMNLEHDATLGYADHIGFRASTCHPFKAYSLSKRKVFDMEVRPLIVMEASAIDPVYMNYGSNDEAYEQIIQLKKKCEDVFGIFSLLWHNSRLIKTEERALFSKLIKSIV
jgi:hypothetical protein